MTPRQRYLLREVEPEDLDGLFELSGHLNSVNLPHDRAQLQRLIETSRRSFTSRPVDPAEGQYMFVLVPADGSPVVGSSLIFSQHGTPSAPHIYFDVLEDEHYSSTLDRHFRHTTLRLGFAYYGPTEIGALVLDPSLRSSGLGKPLSFVRFVFVAMYRSRFRDEVIAELMPPLEADGRSRLWEHLGRRFTGLDYQSADKLSQHNKEFIVSLFPAEMTATLLPEDVRGLIGEVGPATRPVRRMLEEVGFRYSRRIDPFDGGPHFHADTDKVTVVRHTRAAVVDPSPLDEQIDQAVLFERESRDGAVRALVAVGSSVGPTRFRATVAAVSARREPSVRLTRTTQKLLQVGPSDLVYTSPI